jgi:hypothetical protein
LCPLFFDTFAMTVEIEYFRKIVRPRQKIPLAKLTENSKIKK